MSVQWTNHLELQFLEYYQTEPILWDANCKDHKNKLKVHDAWMRISALMEMPVEILKQKRVSLLSSYRKYKNMYKKSLTSGAGADEVKKPSWFAYEIMDSFLGDTTTCNNTTNTESANSAGSLEVEHDTDESQGSQTQSNTERTAPQTIRRRQNPPELLDAGKLIKETLDTFKTTLKRNVSETPPKQLDDCDLYTQLLATKLRSMPIEKRQKLMLDIDGLYLRSQYQFEPFLSPTHYRSPQSPFTESSCTSPSTEPATQYVLKTMRNTQSHERPDTSFSTFSEPAVVYTQNTTRKTQSHVRPSSSISTLSEPAIHYTQNNIQNTRPHVTPGSSFSTHTEPTVYYIQDTIENTQTQGRSGTSNIIIQSDERIYPPVLHIPDNEDVNSSVEDSIDINTSIIDRAYNLS